MRVLTNKRYRWKYIPVYNSECTRNRIMTNFPGGLIFFMID